MKEEAAAILALQILAQLTEEPDTLERFLANSGLGSDQLAQCAGDLAFLGAVLDHVLQDEPVLINICGRLDIDPKEVIRARAALPGGIGDWA